MQLWLLKPETGTKTAVKSNLTLKSLVCRHSELSGVGKGTRALIFHTTQAPRNGVMDGAGYDISIGEFERLITEAAFVEYRRLFRQSLLRRQKAHHCRMNRGWLSTSTRH